MARGTGGIGHHEGPGSRLPQEDGGFDLGRRRLGFGNRFSLGFPAGVAMPARSMFPNSFFRYRMAVGMGSGLRRRLLLGFMVRVFGGFPMAILGFCRRGSLELGQIGLGSLP